MQAVTSDDFEQEVVESTIPVLVDFWASWCTPCQALNPVLAEMDSEADGEYKIVKVDVDVQEELASIHQISAIPTVLIFRNGVLTERFVGLRTKSQLLHALRA